jgi:hypothetical protein
VPIGEALASSSSTNARLLVGRVTEASSLDQCERVSHSGWFLPGAFSNETLGVKA